MVEVEELMAQKLEYHKIEELSEDIDSEVFDTILLNGLVETIKNKMNLLRDQGTDVHDICWLFFHHFSTYKTLSCPEFVDVCTASYFSFGRVIMDLSKSTILFPVSPLIIRKTLSLPIEFSQNTKEYNEESIFQCFRESTMERR